MVLIPSYQRHKLLIRDPDSPWTQSIHPEPDNFFSEPLQQGLLLNYLSNPSHRTLQGCTCWTWGTRNATTWNFAWDAHLSWKNCFTVTLRYCIIGLSLLYPLSCSINWERSWVAESLFFQFSFHFCSQRELWLSPNSWTFCLTRRLSLNLSQPGNQLSPD